MNIDNASAAFQVSKKWPSQLPSAIPPESLMRADVWDEFSAVSESPAGLFALSKVDEGESAPPHTGCAAA
ncbi:MAG: hypothetical protein QNI85_13915 [Desulfobacterales bacterium]|nr:hypothetical protein [Desulfobacterales bacterium]